MGYLRYQQYQRRDCKRVALWRTYTIRGKYRVISDGINIMRMMIRHAMNELAEHVHF